MPIPDPLFALRAYMLSDPAVAAYSGERIYCRLLPPRAYEDGEWVDPPNLMPRACVVLHRAGGPPRRGNLPIGYPRVDVKCYGAHVEEAGELDLVVFEALDTAVREIANNTLIYDVSAENEGLDMWDSALRSPYTLRTYNVTIAQQYAVAQ